MKNNKNSKAALKEAAIIIAVASLIALLFNQFRIDGLPLVENWATKIFNSPLKISLDEAIREFRQGKAIFLDVRSKLRYQAGHLPNAINLPFDSFYENLPMIKEKILSTERIITYGEETEFSFSGDLAFLLKDSGFKDVRVFLNGWPKWEGAGLPFEKDIMVEN